MLNQDEIVVAGLPLSFPKPTGNQLPTLAEWNQRYIEYVLAFTKGKKTAAARILGINRRTLYRRKKGQDGMDEQADEMHDEMQMDSEHEQSAPENQSMNQSTPPTHADAEAAMGEMINKKRNELNRMPTRHQVQ